MVAKIDEFAAELRKFQIALKRNDAKAVAKFFETAKQRRRELEGSQLGRGVTAVLASDPQ